MNRSRFTASLRHSRLAWLILTLIFCVLLPQNSRARYLNPNTGRFWTMDSYEGNGEDPLSLHKYLYCANNPANFSDPSGHDIGAGSIAIGEIGGLATPVLAGASATVFPVAVVLGGLAVMATTADPNDWKNYHERPYMRLQFQQGVNVHYWSRAIVGALTGIRGRYHPVTKAQVQAELRNMFDIFVKGDYELEHKWTLYKMGGDESKVYRAIIMMSKFVQTHGPTPVENNPRWHQEYLDPNDETSPRIDLENGWGQNLGK